MGAEAGEVGSWTQPATARALLNDGRQPQPSRWISPIAEPAGSSSLSYALVRDQELEVPEATLPRKPYPP
jgi:hypothetical protein